MKRQKSNKDNQRVFDALENAQELYDAYLELSGIADVASLSESPNEPANLVNPISVKPTTPSVLSLTHDYARLA